jgi:branched-chain amino acid transport system permease protein
MLRGEHRAAVTSGAVTFLGLLAVQRVFWPAPAGVIAQGVLIGSLTALIAFGIALVYRSNRIVNFAQGDLGLAPTVFAVVLMVYVGTTTLDPGESPELTFLRYGIVFVVGLAAALAIGALVEVAIVRRFSRSPRLILTVATLGIAQALTALSLAMPVLLNRAWPGQFERRAVPSSFPSPLDWSLTIEPITFDGNDILAMFAVVVVILGLTGFLRFTRVGIAVRASAESADRALLLGIPVRRVQTTVWAIAGVLSFVAIFMRAGSLGLPLSSVLGPSLLVRALAACVIGRMEHFGRIFFAAVGLGIIEQAIVWDTGGSTTIPPILFLIVVLALLLQRRGERARTDEQSQWVATSDVRPVPDELRHLPEVRWLGRGIGIGLLVTFLALPAIIPESRINLVGVIVIYAMVAVSLVVLTGWAGQVSLGQVAFMGLGAAIGGWVTTTQGWDITIALLVAGIAGAVIAMVIGLPALRMPGLYLAVVTLAFAQATALYFLDQGEFEWLPGGRIARNPVFGVINIESETQYFYFTMACMLAVLYAARRLRNARVGRVLVGVRENERAAQSYGVNATRAKLMAFAISGFIASFAGAVFVHHQQSLGITPYQTEESIAVFAMVVIGGLGSLPGALLGAAFVYGAQYFLSTELAFFAGGIGLLLVLMALPSGIGGGIYQLRDGYLRWIAARRKILVPSLSADARTIDAAANTGRERGLALLRQMADVMDATRKVKVDK